MQPDFFIVGVAKAGTTSLYEWLNRHPQIMMSPVKEPHFFSADCFEPPPGAVTSLPEYLKLFESKRGVLVRGEASASYFSHATTVGPRIAELVPRARIIVVLRDPVERAFSDYLMYCRQGVEAYPFLKAIKESKHKDVYIQRYAESIATFIDIFGRSHVLILMFEKLRESPRCVLKQIAEFLDVDPEPMSDIQLDAENVGGIGRGRFANAVLALRHKIPIQKLPAPAVLKKAIRSSLLKPAPPLDRVAAAHLAQIFEPDLRKLEITMGRELPELRKVW
jgi:hypothetical protein